MAWEPPGGGPGVAPAMVTAAAVPGVSAMGVVGDGTGQAVQAAAKADAKGSCHFKHKC